MRERDATLGTKLRALVVAHLTGVSLCTILSKQDTQASPQWEELAQRVMKELKERLGVSE